jgi:hypothetical protein
MKVRTWAPSACASPVLPGNYYGLLLALGLAGGVWRVEPAARSTPPPSGWLAGAGGADGCWCWCWCWCLRWLTAMGGVASKYLYLSVSVPRRRGRALITSRAASPGPSNWPLPQVHLILLGPPVSASICSVRSAVMFRSSRGNSMPADSPHAGRMTSVSHGVSAARGRRACQVPSSAACYSTFGVNATHSKANQCLGN